ncbi:L-threonylcarbamoyladenylate synthase [Sulfitobacter sp. HNIBRBA3233]|uniref:L-threonylcarbamoyladenylate synthase n=1 Tax=Sulfitobacter marinivivus TaxID=3158558 RepID=UPI0032DF3EAB
MRTERLRNDPAGIAVAAELLRAGSLVAFATETVYGLGADARHGEAVARIYEAKGRPSFNPLIVHLRGLAQARELTEMPETALRLAEAFWPGPLTLVLPLKDGHGLSPLVTAGLPTVALRVPAQKDAQALLAAFGGPVAAPSANPSGRISPTTAAHVLAGLDGRIAAVLDAGPCTVGLESTIIGFEGDRAILLRAGGLPVEALTDVLGHVPAPATADTITAPGQLGSHYAPRAQVRLGATDARGSEVLLGFGPVAGDLSLSPSGDLVEAAACLFERLHELDALGRPIAVAAVPETGLGVAINDRLRRAAAPR